MEETTNESSPAQGSEKLVKKLEDYRPGPNLKEILVPAGIILLIILAGGATGYLLATRGVAGASGRLISGGETIQGGQEVGIKNEAFKDTAEGRIEANDSSEIPEGSHKLIRSGGESQTAYLTSSVIDLNQFLGRCVKVWGETFAAQKAGWLMDVGRVKVLNSCPKDL